MRFDDDEMTRDEEGIIDMRHEGTWDKKDVGRLEALSGGSWLCYTEWINAHRRGRRMEGHTCGGPWSRSSCTRISKLLPRISPRVSCFVVLGFFGCRSHKIPAGG